MKKFNKNIVQEFKTGFGRFIAIMAIIALGVGFLIGVMQATPDMKNSMDRYYESVNAYDAYVKGSLGLTQSDLDALAAAEGVESIEKVISTDLLVHLGDLEVAGRVIGLETLGKEDAINKLTLLEGAWPAAGTNEVVVARAAGSTEKVNVGDEIVLDAASGTYGDVYVYDTFKVVGIVDSPDYYYRDAREVTTIGTGVIGCIVYANADVYDLKKEPKGLFSILSNSFFVQDDTVEVVCTDCYLRFRGADDYTRFEDDYKNYVLDACAKIETLGTEQSKQFDAALEKLRNLPGGMSSMVPSSASWYVLDRASTNVSYVSYDLNCEKVEEIAGVFPIFFILVAALVALTSMTRMVEEDRMQIGTFKALGFGKARIMSKYLIYCCLASIIGCVAGILCGFALLPSIFWKAYATMYALPALHYGFSWWLALAVFGISLAGTALVTWFACRSSLRERPATLMQPKAPKAGKRVLLERVGFFWNHLKFKWKATIRNIFRYKKNMILTIISVMGCTALILTGFGLNDSVSAVTDLQYSKVILYDVQVEFDGGESEVLDSFVQSADAALSVYSESGQLLMEDGTESVDLYLVEDTEQFNSFINLHTRKKSAIIDITKSEKQNSIVIPENIAIVYGLEAGDTIGYRAAGGERVEFTVYAVCENYTGSYAYMSRSSYEALFGEVEDNVWLIQKDIPDGDEEQISRDLLKESNVTSVEFVKDSANTFDSLSSTMGLVIAVLVVSAGALAAIVLYNLTNINIEERRREIATLRVLGYRRSEVAGYIYRESAILTITGTLLGLGLGVLLHMFIASRVNSVSMMFGRTIAGWSFLWAFLITIAFAAIVYAFMLIKLNKINMAESLKSNE